MGSGASPDQLKDFMQQMEAFEVITFFSRVFANLDSRAPPGRTHLQQCYEASYFFRARTPLFISGHQFQAVYIHFLSFFASFSHPLFFFSVFFALLCFTRHCYTRHPRVGCLLFHVPIVVVPVSCWLACFYGAAFCFFLPALLCFALLCFLLSPFACWLLCVVS